MVIFLYFWRLTFICILVLCLFWEYARVKLWLTMFTSWLMYITIVLSSNKIYNVGLQVAILACHSLKWISGVGLPAMLLQATIADRLSAVTNMY